MKKTNTSPAGPTALPTVSIIGSGNVATHLALALHAAGCTIRQVLSRSLEHAQILARCVDAQPVNQWQRLDEVADVYLLAVADDALYDLALDLRRYGVLWSPQTFVRDIAMDYRRLPLCIEGNNAGVTDDIEHFASLISPCLYRLDYNQRLRVHLAAVWVSNFVNALNATAQGLMRQTGIDFDMLRPLAEQTLRKWDYGDLWLQQTGPAIRRDEKTLNSQRRQLADQPGLLRLYDQLTALIQQH